MKKKKKNEEDEIVSRVLYNVFTNANLPHINRVIC